MRFFTERPELSPRHVVENYPWGNIPEGGIVVDVGGSHGIISIELARKFPHLRFIVQDLDKPVIQGAERQRPADVADRVEYAVHDFFNKQPVYGADVYFLRAVLHNWSNKYAVKILQNLVPALKPGAKIVLNETVVPKPDENPPRRLFRYEPMTSSCSSCRMLAIGSLLNGKPSLRQHILDTISREEAGRQGHLYGSWRRSGSRIGFNWH